MCECVKREGDIEGGGEIWTGKEGSFKRNENKIQCNFFKLPSNVHMEVAYGRHLSPESCLFFDFPGLVAYKLVAYIKKKL